MVYGHPQKSAERLGLYYAFSYIYISQIMAKIILEQETHNIHLIHPADIPELHL
jgi:hypothetical protein